MERRVFETPLGEVWLHGSTKAFESSAPSVVVLTGAFAAPEAMRAIPGLLGDVPVLIGDLPGNHCPRLMVDSVGAYAAAYASAIRSLDRPIRLCGASIGGTVALAARSPNIEAVVALDPLMDTASAAVLWPGFREALRADPALAPFLSNVFGLTAERVEPRDYFPVLDGLSVPATVLVGSDVGTVPSLVSAADRQRLKAHPLVRLRTVLNVGHDLTMGASSWVIDALRFSAPAGTG